MMDRRAFIGGAGALAVSTCAHAQTSKPLPRVAIVGENAPVAGLPGHPVVRAFVDGLRDLGWVDGRNIAIDYHSPEGRYDEMPRLMQKVLASPVAVIVTAGIGVFAAKRLTDTVPIVAVATNGLVEFGGAASLARPGGNLTGSTWETGLTEISIKQLEYLKSAVPKVSRVAFLTDKGPVAIDPSGRALIDAAARVLGQSIVWVGADTREDLQAAFEAIRKVRVDGLLVDSTTVNLGQMRSIVEFAARQRLPAIYANNAGPEQDGLMSYSADPVEMWKRAARLVDKILKGAQPGDLPIEQPTKFELVINLKTAKALGLTIPQSLLQRVDKVIQ